VVIYREEHEGIRVTENRRKKLRGAEKKLGFDREDAKES